MKLMNVFLSSGNLNDLVQHGLRALRETLPAEQDLTTKVRSPKAPLSVSQSIYACSEPETPFQNVSIGIVGKEMEFTIYDDDDVAPFLVGLEERPQRKVQQRTSYHHHQHLLFVYAS